MAPRDRLVPLRSSEHARPHRPLLALAPVVLGAVVVRPVVLALIALAVVVPVAGCRRGEPPDASRETALVVFAAASLRDVFTTLGKGFEQTHPGVTVAFSFAGSQELERQIEHGAAADVFASADPRHTAALVRAGRASTPVVFASNEVVLIASQESAARLRSLADLPAATRIVLGVPEVPIGRYALDLLTRASGTLGADFRARVEARVVSREPNVRQVLAKVSLGEAEAGFVYRSDALAGGGRVSVVPLPADLRVAAEYPVVVVSGAAHPVLAHAWVELLLSERGTRALHAAGFSGPPRVVPKP